MGDGLESAARRHRNAESGIDRCSRGGCGRPRSEHTARLLDQLELTLEELESSAKEDELAAEMAAAKTTKVASFTRKRPSRQPFPEHLPRERVIVPGPTACARSGGARRSKLGEDIRDAGGGPEILEGDPARPREIYLP
jgi:transposase